MEAEPMPVNTGEKQEGRFQPGISGNPAGRPLGSRNKATQAALALLEGEAELLTRKAIDMALAGDLAALRLCLERILPPCRNKPVSLPLPSIKTSDDALSAYTVIVEEMAKGAITPAEGLAVMALVEKLRAHIKDNAFGDIF